MYHNCQEIHIHIHLSVTYLHVHIYIYMYTHTHIHVHMYIHIHIHAYMRQLWTLVTLQLAWPAVRAAWDLADALPSDWTSPAVQRWVHEAAMLYHL